MVRPILGNDDYLFCGSDAGGERAAAMYSLIGSAKLNGLDPEAYLRYVIEHIAEHAIIAECGVGPAQRIDPAKQG